MLSEKERLNSLKEKIVQYESELEEKNSLLAQYQTIERAADSISKNINILLKGNTNKKTIFYHR